MTPSTQNQSNLIWIDLEMTGLNTETDLIIEIATIMTDSDLNILAIGPVIAIHQSDAQMSAMDDWCTKQHGKSGLTKRVQESKVNETTAETQTIEFLQQWVEKGVSPMCGNSICQDRRFLARHMPELEAYFHYRHIDVSTLKALAQRWNPQLASNFKKQNTHLALDDIKESIAELDHYRKNWLQNSSTST